MIVRAVTWERQARSTWMLGDGWSGRDIALRAAEVLREGGVKALCFKVLGETIYRRMLFLERSLQRPPVPVTPGIPVTFAALKPSDLEALSVLRPHRRPADLLRRLEAGEGCVIARHEGRLAGAMWFQTGTARVEYLRIRIPLEPDEAYLYDGFVHPELRENLIGRALLGFACRSLQDTGLRKLVFAVNQENRSALEAFSECGERTLGVIGVLKIGPWHRVLIRQRNEPPRDS